MWQAGTAKEVGEGMLGLIGLRTTNVWPFLKNLHYFICSSTQPNETGPLERRKSSTREIKGMSNSPL